MIFLDYNQKAESKCIRYICAYILIQALNLFVKNAMGVFWLWPIISKGVLALYMICALTVIIKKELFRFIIAETICVFSFLYTYIIGAGDADIISIAFNVLVVFLPLLFSVLCVKNYGKLLELLNKISWPTTAILLITFMTSSISMYDYNMPLSYAMTLQLLFVFDRFINKRKWYDAILSILLLACIIIGGARGPLVCILFYIVFTLLFSKNISRKRKLILIVALLAAVCLAIAYMDEILSGLIKYLDNKGMSSRTLYMIYNKNFSDSGRDSIYLATWKLIKDRPVFGYGPAGGWEHGFYPHNIFIELILSYGIIMGVLFSITLIVCGTRGLRLRDLSKRRMALIFLSYSISLLLSNSYVLEPIFFITLPICLSEFHLRRWHRKRIRYE